MGCELIHAELVSYHFGSVPHDTRAAVEAHLLACPGCLKSFLALKREIETAQSSPRPSPSARDRLRRAVANELELRVAVPSAPGWWRRPLAFGFAAAAGMAAMVAVVAVRGQLQHLAELSDQASVQRPAGR